MYDIPQTQGLLFMKYTPPHPILPYFLLHPGRGTEQSLSLCVAGEAFIRL